MGTIAQKYITLSKNINKTETETIDARYGSICVTFYNITWDLVNTIRQSSGAHYPVSRWLTGRCGGYFRRARPRLRPQRRRLFKRVFIFSVRNFTFIQIYSVRACLICYECFQLQIEIRKLNRSGSRCQKVGNLSFHVVELQRTGKKCTKNYKGHAQPLFCSLNM